MHLKAIFYFLAIVEEGSLSKAAEKLFITQPTLSHFLATLERELGVALFYRRNNRGLELNAAGQIYYEGAKKIAEFWRNMRQELENCKESSARVIRCGTGGADPITHKLVLCFQRLQTRYPGTELRSWSATPDEIHKMLLEGKLDLGYSAYLKENSSLTYVSLVTSEVDLALPEDHPLAHYSYQIPGNEHVRIPLSMAEGVPFALITEGSVLRQVEEEYFSKVNFRPEILAVYSFVASLKEYIQYNRLAGLLPRFQHIDGIAQVALSPPMYYTCGLYYRNDIKLSAPVKYLIALLKEYPVDYDL